MGTAQPFPAAPATPPRYLRPARSPHRSAQSARRGHLLTGQGAAVALLVAAEILPVLLLGPVAGVVIDRFPRKAVLIGADLVRAVLVVTLVWPQGAWHAYVVAAGLAAGNTFFNPTVQAVIFLVRSRPI